MFCWCFLLDIVVCGLSIMVLIASNIAAPMVTDENNDIEESIALESILIQSEHLKLNTNAFLRGIGKTSHFDRKNRS